MFSNSPQNIENQTNKAEDWFDEMVANLRYDQSLYEIDVLDEGKKKVYNTMMSGNQESMSNMGREFSTTYFVSRIIDEYFKELTKTKSAPNKMALELSHSKILVWAEIDEDDEIMEDALILTEAKINAYFSKYGFYISSTIVESSDGLKVPEHYKTIPIIKH